MPSLTDSDLRDLAPPLPGRRERALVATRARQLGRRRRVMQGAGALAVVAAVSVSVAALTAGGPSGSGANNQIEAASSPDVTDSTAPTTTVGAPTTVPAPAPTTSPAAVAEAPAPAAQDTTPVAPAAPSTFTVSGTISNFPEGATVTLTLNGPAGTFTATADGAGNFAVSGLPAGTYQALGQWVDSTKTATRGERWGSVTVDGDSSVDFAFL